MMPQRTHWLGMGFVAALGVLLSGCLPEKRVEWSPDGRHAALITGGGLYVCDETGQLSPRLAADAQLASWLPDSETLVVVRSIEARNWDELTATVDPEYVARLEVIGDELRAQVMEYEGDFEGFKPTVLEAINTGEAAAAVLYLRDAGLEGPRNELRARVGEELWGHLDDASVTVSLLEVGAYTGATFEVDCVLGSELQAPHDLRVSPDGEFLAYLGGQSNGLMQLRVVPLDGSARPQTVMENTSAYADWSPDGRSLACATTKNPPENAKDDLRLGVVATRVVRDEAGRLLEEFPEPHELAGIIHQIETKVRYAPDGRVVFASLELTLPCAAEDMPDVVGLFAVDPERQPTVVRLLTRRALDEVPEGVSAFELSPDGLHVCIPGGDGEVAVVTIATGSIWELLPENAPGRLWTVPAWRTLDSLAFVARAGEAAERTELMLVHLDFAERAAEPVVLSADWNEDVRIGLLVEAEDTQDEPEEGQAEHDAQDDAELEEP